MNLSFDYKSFLLLAVILFGMGCNSVGNENTLPKEYDFSNPETFNMPASLTEISGIAFNKGINSTIYAIQDEEGKLFHLNWQNQKNWHTKFAGKGDYEDLTIVKDQVVVLKSNGSLYSFPFSETKLDETGKTREWKNLVPKGEYEGIYGDESSGKVYVLCKNCAGDIAEKKVSGYIFQTGTSIQKVGSFSLNVDEIKTVAGKVKKGFQPSALAKNPVTGDWFILSSWNKLLIVTDKNWKPKHSYALSSNNFNQPEGIAFDKTGNLYISNEGDNTKDGNVLKFKRLAK